jgi:hypothetical protein
LTRAHTYIHIDPRQWLEKRFLLHLWDDVDAAERERERVHSTQPRLMEEIERLRELRA